MDASLSALRELGVSEKLQLLEDLWDDIAAHPESVPIPDWQKAELKRRKEKHLKNPHSGSSWEDVKQRVRNRNGR